MPCASAEVEDTADKTRPTGRLTDVEQPDALAYRALAFRCWTPSRRGNKRVADSGARLIVPVPNLGVSQVWEVGQVRFHPAGSADALVMTADAQLSGSAPSLWYELVAEKVTGFGQAAVAELVAGNLDEAMPEVASALAVLRAVQHMRHPMSGTSRATFGLPGPGQVCPR